MSEKQKTIENVLKKKIIDSICNSESRWNIKSNVDTFYVPICLFLEQEYPTFIKVTIIQTQFFQTNTNLDNVYNILMRLCGYGLLERKVIENCLYVRMREDIKNMCDNELDIKYLEQKKAKESIKRKPQEI